MLGVAPLLAGQATPSIAPRADERRDVVSLREYIDIRFKALTDQLQLAEDARKERDTARQTAIDKAEQGINKRLEGVPETFVTKQEFSARADGVDSRLADIDKRFAGFDGQLKVYFGIYGFGLLILGIWLSKRITITARKNGHVSPE
jgi:hypothetical protein